MSFIFDTGMQVYFCDSHSPWQRGIAENTNRLLRQYLPRYLDFSTLDQEELDKIAAELMSDLERPWTGRRLPSDSPSSLQRPVEGQPTFRSLRPWPPARVFDLLGRKLFTRNAGGVPPASSSFFRSRSRRRLRTKMEPLAMLGSAVAVTFLVQGWTCPSRPTVILYLAGQCAGEAFCLRLSTIGVLKPATALVTILAEAVDARAVAAKVIVNHGRVFHRAPTRKLEVWTWLEPEQRAAVKTHLQLIDTMTPRIDELDGRIEERAEEEPAACLLQTLPGIGPYRSLTLVGEITPIERFPSNGKLVSYVGLVPANRNTAGEVLV